MFGVWVRVSVLGLELVFRDWGSPLVFRVRIYGLRLVFNVKVRV